jgi:hypothetical protein
MDHCPPYRLGRRLVELADKWPPCAMVVDDNGWSGNRAVYF